jgi:hypothetical protein
VTRNLRKRIERLEQASRDMETKLQALQQRGFRREVILAAARKHPQILLRDGKNGLLIWPEFCCMYKLALPEKYEQLRRDPNSGLL